MKFRRVAVALKDSSARLNENKVVKYRRSPGLSVSKGPSVRRSGRGLSRKIPISLAALLIVISIAAPAVALTLHPTFETPTSLFLSNHHSSPFTVTNDSTLFVGQNEMILTYQIDNTGSSIQTGLLYIFVLGSTGTIASSIQPISPIPGGAFYLGNVTFFVNGIASSYDHVQFQTMVSNNAGPLSLPSSSPVLNIVWNAVWDEDSSSFGYWAIDNYTATTVVYNIGVNNYLFYQYYYGTATTYAGLNSPGQNLTQQTNAVSLFSGYIYGTFSSTTSAVSPGASFPLTGNLGIMNYGGSIANLFTNLKSSYTGIPAPNPFGINQIISTYFTGYVTNSLAEPYFWFSYHYAGQYWIDASSNLGGTLMGDILT